MVITENGYDSYMRPKTKVKNSEWLGWWWLLQPAFICLLQFDKLRLSPIDRQSWIARWEASPVIS